MSSTLEKQCVLGKSVSLLAILRCTTIMSSFWRDTDEMVKREVGADDIGVACLLIGWHVELRKCTGLDHQHTVSINTKNYVASSHSTFSAAAQLPKPASNHMPSD
jgi:hypothetical protein